jgi:hypothetical protein
MTLTEYLKLPEQHSNPMVRDELYCPSRIRLDNPTDGDRAVWMLVISCSSDDHHGEVALVRGVLDDDRDHWMSTNHYVHN